MCGAIWLHIFTEKDDYRIVDCKKFRRYLWSEFCEEVSDYFNYQFDDYSELFSTVMLEPKARYMDISQAIVCLA